MLEPVEGYVARAVQQWAAMKGPGNDTSGGVAIRPVGDAKGLLTTKRWEKTSEGLLLRLRMSGDRSRVPLVVGGITWRKRRHELIDEVPTPFRLGWIDAAIRLVRKACVEAAASTRPTLRPLLLGGHSESGGVPC